MFRMKLRPGSAAREMSRALQRGAAVAIGAAALVFSSQAFACPNVKDVENLNMLPDSNLGAAWTIDPGTPGTAAYTLTIGSFETKTSDGVPGLIEYCIYPDPTAGIPNAATVDPNLVGADGSAWVTDFPNAQGYFAFSRPKGDPTNLPLYDDTDLVDYSGPAPLTINMGTASWTGPVTLAPTNQIVVLHINDTDECSNLYGAGTQSCFVLPGFEHGPPQPHACIGEVACKQVTITQAITTQPLTVPMLVQLNIEYDYVIQNVGLPPNANMLFYPYVPGKTKDINTGGGKDYFGCEQQPNPLLDPGDILKNGIDPIYPYQTTPFSMNFQIGNMNSNGTNCTQSSFFMQIPPHGPNPFVLKPTDPPITFTVFMQTRQLKNLKFEYTSCGTHVLNSGFTVKWIESDDNMLHSFATAPISVFAEPPPGSPPCTNP